MSAYETFRPADVPWINMIPTHWETKRLKELLAERKESNNPVKTTDILSLTNTRGVIPYAQKGNIGNKSKENLENYKLAYPNDLVLNSMNVIIGSVGLSQYFGAVSPVYYMLYPRKNDNIRYFEYIFKLKTIQEYLKGLGNGILAIRMRIPMIKLNNVLLPVPPREEQDQIVRYLDWQVSKINKLISTRKKQIALLDELRRSITCHCVINGVDGNIKRKETEINWIDHIPEHWNVLFLSQVATEQAIKNTGLIEKNLLSLSYGRIVNKDINTAEGLLPASFEGYQIIHPGNIILRLTDLQNDHKSLRVGLSTQTGIITSAYTCLKVRDNILPEYLYLQLHSADICKVFYGMGGGVRQSIGYKDIRKMPVVVPPIEEQKLIVQKIHTLIAPFDTHIGKLNEKILHLSEYRTRLISDVVTGQIDVRDIEVPEFEYIADDVDDVSDDENTDAEEAVEEEE